MTEFSSQPQRVVSAICHINSRYCSISHSHKTKGDFTPRNMKHRSCRNTSAHL
ncbi:unnamed protein product [Haemonchus placei]|uniref:Uncharacterized protein n=1 Tax=Haemonchus placei TaxID=6290 RepID=A0A3P7XIZ6_HAEPC|nr:unnamed protein product [Haemonchus placei]